MNDGRGKDREGMMEGGRIERSRRIEVDIPCSSVLGVLIP